MCAFHRVPCWSDDDLLYYFPLPHGRTLFLVDGSVLDFVCGEGAVVNAANVTCQGGGGVDKAITEAGGLRLAQARALLPKLPGGIRCPTGQAKVTGPDKFGSIGVPYVIHAVGPNYANPQKSHGLNNILLKKAYKSALDCTTIPSTQNPPITRIAFPLLSGGIFRGDQVRTLYLHWVVTLFFLTHSPSSVRSSPYPV